MTKTRAVVYMTLLLLATAIPLWSQGATELSQGGVAAFYSESLPLLPPQRAKSGLAGDPGVAGGQASIRRGGRTPSRKAGSGRLQAASSEAGAQDLAPLSLDGVLKQVLARHPLVIAAEREVEVARGVTEQSRQVPSPNLSYNYSRVTHQGEASELFEFPGKRSLRGQAAEIGVEQAQQNLLKTRSALAFEVRQAFLKRMLADQDVAAAQQTLNAVRDIRDAARKRFQAGDVAELEVIKAEVELARAQQQVNIAMGQQRVATLTLNTLLQRPPNTPLAVTGNLATETPVPPLDDLLQLAYREQPAIAMAREEADKRQRELALARRQKFPDLDLGFSYGVEDLVRTPGVRASIAIPLPGRYHGQVEEAAGRHLAALAGVQAEVYRVTEEVASAYQQWLAARAQVQVYRSGLLNQSVTALRAAEESYREGESGILDVLDAERTDLMVRQEYQRTLYDLQLAAANVILARGGVQ